MKFALFGNIVYTFNQPLLPLQVHSGLKPFKCDICSAAFADRFALKRHRGIHEKYGNCALRTLFRLGERFNLIFHSVRFSAGQTAPLHQSQIVQKEEIIEMDDSEKSREVIIGTM